MISSKKPSSRAFLARPFWRDYVLAYVLIGIGCLIFDAAAMHHGVERVFLLVPAIATSVTGTSFFIFAVGYSLWTTFRRVP